MKTLAQYLAEYIDEKVLANLEQPENRLHLQDVIEQGIEAYQSTENCTLGICGGDCPDCNDNVPMVIGDAMLYNGEDEIEVCKYECPECGYIVYG